MSKSRDIADSAATINYIDGLTSDAQTQINAKPDNLSDFGVTASASELNTLDGITATTTELNYVDGVTSAIQTQLDAKGVGSVTSVGGTGSVQGLTLSGSVTSSGNLTLGGSLSSINISSQTTGTLPVNRGGTGATSLTANNVLLGNGSSAPQAVAPSTAGNVLTSNGSTWQSTAPAGGGAWSLLATVSASAASYATFDGYFSSAYTNYVLIGEGIYTGDAGNDSHLAMQVKVNSTWKTNQEYLSVANNVWSIAGSGYQTVWQPNFDTGFLLIQDLNQSTNALGSASLECTIFAPALTVMANRVHFKSSRGYSPYSPQGDRIYAYNGVGHWGNTDAINGIRLFPKSGNITGTFRLYGIKNS